MPDASIPKRWLQSVLNASYETIIGEPDYRQLLHVGDVDLAERLFISDEPAGMIVLHEWITDDPLDIHDHPWDNASVVLSGGYFEITPQGRFWRPPGSVIVRRAEDPHRIEIDPTGPLARSLFIMGPVHREPGFHTAAGWVSADDYTRRLSKQGGPRGLILAGL